MSANNNGLVVIPVTRPDVSDVNVSKTCAPLVLIFLAVNDVGKTYLLASAAPVYPKSAKVSVLVVILVTWPATSEVNSSNTDAPLVLILRDV